MPNVGLFFVVEGHLFLHDCPKDKADKAGGFINYPFSHDQIWRKYYHQRFGHDFDYYPRGRILYNRDNDTWMLYKDHCIKEQELRNLLKLFHGLTLRIDTDKHYQCHMCNAEYKDI